MTLCELVHMMQPTPQQSDEALLLWMRDLVAAGVDAARTQLTYSAAYKAERKKARKD